MSTARTSRKQADPPKEEPEERPKSGPPVWTRRCFTGSGSVEVGIFEREMQSDNGTYLVWNTVVKRSFKTDKTPSGFDSGNSFRFEDLLILSLYLEEAASWISSEMNRK